MNYRVPVAEQMFLLDTIAEVREMAGSDTFPNFDVELILPVLTAAANLAEGSYSPLSRNGDRVGARWEDGSVTMPPGYRAAYQAYVEGGWGSLNASSRQGGQGLPFVLATAVQEGLGTADLAFALVHMLTQGAAAALLAHGSESQKGAWLEHLLTGSWPGTMNLTEPQAGSDLGAIATMARRTVAAPIPCEGRRSLSPMASTTSRTIFCTSYSRERRTPHQVARASPSSWFRNCSRTSAAIRPSTTACGVCQSNTSSGCMPRRPASCPSGRRLPPAASWWAAWAVECARCSR